MKFNFFNKENKTTTNFQGAVAYKTSPETELYTAVVTNLVSNAFYENTNERLLRIKNLVKQCDPVFVAKLAVYCRTEMNMRSMPIVLTVELAKIYNGDSLVQKTVAKVVQRADEITEILAYYQMTNERKYTKKLNKLSKQIQKGLNNAFNNFDEYQFAKYNRNTAVSLKDALFLVHPKAKDENQQLIFNKIVNNTLATPYTWETELSKVGQNKYHSTARRQRAFKETWEQLIASKKVGYMAILRNLRTILELELSSKAMQDVLDYLSNETAVANSKQFPFRFLATYNELKNINSCYNKATLQALETAAMLSVQNLKGFDFDTSVLVACDVSGSMMQPVSANSKMMYYDVGLMLGMMISAKCQNVTTGLFGDKWMTVNLPNNAILANVDKCYSYQNKVGFSTNGHLVLENLYKENRMVDKILFFTDVQMWNSTGSNSTMQKAWNMYKNKFPGAKLYLFDLAGYGKQAVNVAQKDVYLIAGWNDKIFDSLNAMDNMQSVLTKINKIDL